MVCILSWTKKNGPAVVPLEKNRNQKMYVFFISLKISMAYQLYNFFITHIWNLAVWIMTPPGGSFWEFLYFGDPPRGVKIHTAIFFSLNFCTTKYCS